MGADKICKNFVGQFLIARNNEIGKEVLLEEMLTTENNWDYQVELLINSVRYSSIVVRGKFLVLK